MAISIESSGEACGAFVRGIDLREPLSHEQLETLRAALFTHHVLCFEDQPMPGDHLEKFASALGEIGDDPFFNGMPDRKHVVAIHRRPDETTPIFAEAWHSDWSFLPQPPQATFLYGVTIPPNGGDTLFANQQRAYAELPAELKAFVDDHCALHSARHTYSPRGIYAERAEKPDDSGISVRVDETAYALQVHPLVKEHPHTARPALFGILEGYIVEVQDMPYLQALKRLLELRDWQIRPEFQYRHRWRPNSLVIWDNDSVLHRATGGYDGHERLLHRITLRSIPRAAAGPSSASP